MKRWRVRAAVLTAILAVGGWMFVRAWTSGRIDPAPPMTDELPDGAVARIGDIRFRPRRHGNVGLTWDGKGLVAGASDGFVRIFDVDTGREVRRFEVHTDTIWRTPPEEPWWKRIWNRNRRPLPRPNPDGIVDLAVSPDGRRVATLGGHGYVLRVTDLETGERLADWHVGRNWFCVGWTPDGTTGFVTRGAEIATWSIGPAAPPGTVTAVVQSGAFSTPPPVASVLGVGAQPNTLYEIATGRKVTTALGADFNGIVEIEPGARYATVSGKPSVVRILDADLVETARFDAPAAFCWPLAPAPDRRHLLIASREAVFVVALDGRVVHRLPLVRTHQALPSRDGHRIAIVGAGVTFVGTDTWAVRGEETALAHASQFGVRDGDVVVALVGTGVASFAARTGREAPPRRPLSPVPAFCVFEPRGRLLFATDYEQRWWQELGTDRRIDTTMQLYAPSLGWSGGRGLAAATFGGASADAEDRFALLDLASGRAERVTGWDQSLTFGPEFCADGSHVVSFGPDGVTLVATSPPFVGRVLGAPTALTGSPSRDASVIAATYDDMQVRVFRTDGAKELMSAPCDWIYVPIALSLDGSRVAWATRGGCSIELRDVATGKRLALFEGHGAAVSTLRFNADGSLLVSGSRDDGTILVWDVAAAAR